MANEEANIRPKEYFKEHEDEETDGFVILAESDTRFRVAECWDPADLSKRWIDYWVSREKMSRRLHEGDCERTGKVVSDEQFKKIRKLTGVGPMEVKP